MPDSILRILVIFHLIVLLTIFAFYRLTRKRIVTSVRGPSKDTEHEFPKKFLLNLRLIYLSFFIYELGSFLTYFIALVLDLDLLLGFKTPHYFAIGGVNLFAWLSYLIFFPAVDWLFKDLYSLKIEDEINQKRNIWKYLFIICFIILLYFFINAEEEDIYNKFIIIRIMVLLLIPLVIAQVTNYIKKSRGNVNNPDILIRLRLNLLSIIIGLIVAGVLTINFIFLSPDDVEANWPTRNPVVELFILYPAIHTLFGAAGIYIIIRLPRWLRLKFNITDEIYYRYQDSRMDYDWRQIDRRDSSDLYPVKSDVIHEESILIYNGEFDEKLINSFADFYDPDHVIKTNQYQEEFISKYLLPYKNIVVLANHRDAFIDILIDKVQEKSGKRIEFNGDISIRDFKYTLETALFAGFPSIWHPEKSITLLLAKPKIQTALCEFVLTYGKYLNEVVKEQEIFYIIKFPRIKNTYPDIPPNKDDQRKPDDYYIDMI